MITTLTIKKAKGGWEASIYEDERQVARIKGVSRSQVVSEGLHYFLLYIDDASELEKLYNKKIGD
jgi:hypothetical protein